MTESLPGKLHVRTCWAKTLGDCAGKLTGEHPISNSLLGKTIKFKGLPWCRSEMVTISAATAKAHILCDRHNNLLSEADSTAKNLQDAIACLGRRVMTGEPKTKSSSPPHFYICGKRLTQWLCKTHCNLAILSGSPVCRDFVRCAFWMKPFCYDVILDAYENQVLCIDTGQFGYQHIWSESGKELFFLNFCGLDFFVTNFRVRYEDWPDLAKLTSGRIGVRRPRRRKGLGSV
jgi:hypothetical protein